MSAVARLTPLDEQQHLVLDHMSWAFYEHLLKEIGNRHVRVTFDDGWMEIMTPLLRHERYAEWIRYLILFMCMELSIRIHPLGSTTFRDKTKKKGLEPDRCFYIRNADAVARMGREFNPKADPPPDLALEIDITSRSVPHEPIYAALGVPEIWRYDSKQLHVLHLTRKGNYAPRKSSLAFPFLPMKEFATYIPRLHNKDQMATFRRYRNWLVTLAA